MEHDPTRMLALVVGLPGVDVLGVEDDVEGPIGLLIEKTLTAPVLCGACGSPAWVNDRRTVELVDLPAFGRPTRLWWRKRRFRCSIGCGRGTWTEADTAIAWPRFALTDRAGRWVTRQVGRHGRAVSDVAAELGCDWHTVNDAVIAYGTALVDDDPDRLGAVAALGLDETLFCKTGSWHRQYWCTSIVDVGGGGLLDVVAGRTAAGPSAWIMARDQAWRDAVRYGVLDLSGPYRKTFNTVLADVVQVADPFHVVKVANTALDEVRRRVQNETLGHRGHRDDPLYRARRLLTKAHERLDDKGGTKLAGLLQAGDPRHEVRDAWHAKEVVRSIYDINDPGLAEDFVTQLAADLQDTTMPFEVRRLGRTLKRWKAQIVAWHTAQVTNGPTEAANNLIKRVKRGGFGFTRFRNYRIRVLLYAGKPNWDLLATLTPR